MIMLKYQTYINPLRYELIKKTQKKEKSKALKNKRWKKSDKEKENLKKRKQKFQKATEAQIEYR